MRSRFFITAVLLLLASCGKKEEVTTTETSVSITSESWTVADFGVLETGPAISGTLKPKRQATIRSQIGGAILAMYAEQGQAVGTGQTLATIDDRSLTEAVTSAQSAVSTARSSLTLAQREEERLETLVKAGAVAQRDVEAARRNTINAQGQLSAAQSQLSAAQKQLSYTRLTSPMSGKISEKLASTGDIVQPGAAIYTVVDPSSMQLEAFVSADQLGEVRIGVPVQFQITGYPGQTFTGTVTRINPSVDPATRQVRIYVEIPNTSGVLLGELFAEGRVASRIKTVLTVPESAIDRRMVSPTVMRVKQGKTERVAVTLGPTDPATSSVQILTGVERGDTILLGAALAMTPGSSVRLTPKHGTQQQPVDTTRRDSTMVDTSRRVYAPGPDSTRR
ncbi:MAG TPA: efflux RND transporter periplasmic adaptor subunit [Candidatus Kapabacteria bacterium]|nr:efflux RND transporter periplasmic adaptor subunit [Candidatus Kapabacteria bacterium]